MADLRRFPRIPHNVPLTIEVNTERSPATLENMSCQGAEVTLGPGCKLIPGSTVELRLCLEGTDLSLPARVVWLGGTRAGLRLRLGQAPDATKKAFGGWIVPLTNQAIARLKEAAA